MYRFGTRDIVISLQINIAGLTKHLGRFMILFRNFVFKATLNKKYIHTYIGKSLLSSS